MPNNNPQGENQYTKRDNDVSKTKPEPSKPAGGQQGSQVDQGRTPQDKSSR